MRPLSLLFVALFNSILGLSILFPILAPLGRELGLGELQISSLSAGYALMQLLVSPYWGRRSEKIGRKPVLLTGILGFSLSFFAFAGAAELGKRGVLTGHAVYLALLASRLIGGTLSSATLPTAQAYVADVTEREARTSGMAVIGAAFGLGVIFGPAIGAGLSTFGLLTPVYASAGFAIVNALFVWWRLPEPARHATTEEGPPVKPTDGRVWPLLATGLVATLSSVAMEQTVAFYFQDQLHLDEASTPRVVGMALVVYGLVAVFIQGFVIRRFEVTPATLLRLGPPIALAGFVLFVFANDFWSLTAALALQGAGQGLVLPGVTSALSLSVGDHEQGTVAGLNSSAQALARMLGPLAGGGLYEIAPHYPYAFSAVLLALLMLALFGWVARHADRMA
ncbi:MAG: MFS transporter [Myxococcales bacterium]|nr:MFS transporter [Myxococcales bacterium]